MPFCAGDGRDIVLKMREGLSKSERARLSCKLLDKEIVNLAYQDPALNIDVSDLLEARKILCRRGQTNWFNECVSKSIADTSGYGQRESKSAFRDAVNYCRSHGKEGWEGALQYSPAFGVGSAPLGRGRRRR